MFERVLLLLNLAFSSGLLLIFNFLVPVDWRAPLLSRSAVCLCFANFLIPSTWLIFFRNMFVKNSSIWFEPVAFVSQSFWSLSAGLQVPLKFVAAKLSNLVRSLLLVL